MNNSKLMNLAAVSNASNYVYYVSELDSYIFQKLSSLSSSNLCLIKTPFTTNKAGPGHLSVFVGTQR